MTAEENLLRTVFGGNTAVTKQEQSIELLLGVLTPREREVIELRFDLRGSGQPHSLDEIAQSYGITRERIRQIEFGALEKMKRRANP